MFKTSQKVDWDVCPSDLPCCNEYGYCRSREEWTQQSFRDCNGVSNGIDLPDSVLDLENTLGGDPGPGLGADSDFDKRQLERVGSGSPAQGLNPFALAPVPVPDDFDFDGDRGAANSGSSSASGGFRSRGSNGRDDPSNGIGSSASSRGSSSRRGSNRERTPVGSSRGSSSSSGSSSSTGSNGGRAPSGNNSGSSRRTNGNQGFPFSGVGNQRRQQAGSRGQQGRRTGGQSPVAQNTATRRIPPSRNPPRAFPPRINTPKSPSTKFVSSGNQNLLAQVFGESTETERPRLPAKPSQFVPRPSAGRRRPRPGPSNNVRARPAIGQQQSTTRNFSGGSTRKSLRGQGSSRTRGSTSRSEASSSGTKDIKPTDLYPLAGYKNTAGYPMNLNAENCPNYPFCYWNPYGAGSKD